MGQHRAPLPSYDPNSKATLEYETLWEEIKMRILEEDLDSSKNKKD
jgi:hypothetical protein